MVWICTNCKKGQHKSCKNKWQCDCQCNVGGDADAAQKSLAIGGGIGLAVGGLALTICTGGLGAILVGGAMLGAGISSTWNGAEKAIKKERINGKTFVADVAFGAITGVATGGVGAAGETIAANVVKQGAKEVAKAGAKKLAVRAATGVVTGVASKAIDEVKQCSTTDKKWTDYGKSFDKDGKENGTATAWIGSGLAGGLGGVGSHVGSNLTTKVSSRAAESVTRVAVSGTTAAVSDATIQGVNIATGNQDEYDFKRTVTCAASSAIMTAAQEGTKNAIYSSHGGKDAMLNNKTNRRIIKNEVPEKDRKPVLKAYDDLQKIPQSKLDDEAAKAFTVTNHQLRENQHRAVVHNYDEQINSELASKLAAIDAKDFAAAGQHTNRVKTLIVEKNAAIKSFQTVNPAYQRSDIEHMNSQNAHFLTGDNVQQIAVDVKPNSNAPRGATRATFDYNVNQQGKAEYRFADYNDQHQYENMARYGDGDHRFSQVRNDYDSTLNTQNDTMTNVSRSEAVELSRKKEEKEKKEKKRD